MPQGTAARTLSLKSHFGASKHADALTTLYFALFRGDPSNSGVEPTSTGNYARVAKTNDGTLWPAIGAGATQVANNAEIQWPVATGVYSITLALTWWAIFDNSTGGNLWYWGQLSPTITVTGAGDQPRIPV